MDKEKESARVIRVKRVSYFSTKKNKLIGKIRLILISFLTFLLLAASFIAYGVDSNSDLIDDNLDVSLAPAGTMTFAASGAGVTATMAEVTFDGDESDYLNESVQARLVTNNATTATIGSGSGSLNLADAVVWGGSGGTGKYAAPGGTNGQTRIASNGYTLEFTADQQYVGFWWSAGDPNNYFQLLDVTGQPILAPQFSTQSVLNAMFRSLPENQRNCPAFPGPTDTQLSTTPNYAYCGNPVRDNSPDGYLFGYVNEPFAFIHLRYSNGFRGIQFWGTGFEFDSLVVSETIPSSPSTEIAVSDNNVNANVPSVLLVDPRVNSKSLPSMNLMSSIDAHICISQVANATGGTLSGDATITVSRTTVVPNVTPTPTTNLWRFSGTRANLQTQIPSIQIQGLSGQPLVPSESKYIRVHLSSNTALAGCTDTQVNQIVEIRPYGLTSTLRKGTIQLK